MRRILLVLACSTGVLDVAIAQCAASEGGVSSNRGTPSYAISYSIKQQGDRVSLLGAAIIRAPREWLDRQASRASARPTKPSGALIDGGGGTVGPAWIVYESDSAQFWVDTVRMPVPGENVLLIEVGEDGIPRRVGSALVDDRFPSAWPCPHNGGVSADGVSSGDALLEVLRRSPKVQNFLRARPLNEHDSWQLRNPGGVSAKGAGWMWGTESGDPELGQSTCRPRPAENSNDCPVLGLRESVPQIHPAPPA
jgi:hypothetical protein